MMNLTVMTASVPDRDQIVAEIWANDTKQLAEISIADGQKVSKSIRILMVAHGVSILGSFKKFYQPPLRNWREADLPFKAQPLWGVTVTRGFALRVRILCNYQSHRQDDENGTRNRLPMDSC